jgi:hypothetical protein
MFDGLWERQGGDVIRLRHAEVEGQLAAFPTQAAVPLTRQPSTKLPLSPLAQSNSSAVSLLLNPEEDDNHGSSLSLWEVCLYRSLCPFEGVLHACSARV